MSNKKQARAIQRFLQGLPLTRAQGRQVRKSIGASNMEWRSLGHQARGLVPDELTKSIVRNRKQQTLEAGDQ